MTKRVNAKKKISRSLGVNLWGQGNSTFLKRNSRPGQHGMAPKRSTNYGIHLLAKQKIRKYYDIKEYQFRNLFFEAKRLRGNTEDDLVSLLESRLSSIVFRANFAPTIFSARQLVNHGHVMVNGKVVNIPSFMVGVGDVVSISPKASDMVLVNETLEKMERDIPNYLELNSAEKTIKLLYKPKTDEVSYPFEPDFSMIVEFYSQ